MLGSKLVLFGGLNSDYMLDNSLDIVEFDPNVVKRYIDRAKRKISKVTTMKEAVVEAELEVGNYGGGPFRPMKKFRR